MLRALDLFFNHDKRDGYALEWARDYCCFAAKRIGKAEEIEVSLEITPPDSFANRNPVIWKKIWRKTGLHVDSLLHLDKTEIKSTSKVVPFVKAMRFDYVPAIKGTDYFQSLMSKLHDMLKATVEGEVRDASGAFTKTINDNTKPILDEILKRLGLETSIQLPPNLRELFAQLEFTSVSGTKPFSLQQRGDGVKVRHIPIVLRWLAEQANHLSAPGRPKTVTIWGFEEPENNLELRRCFDLAKEFVEGASEIQSFVTTHSPAFYSVFRGSDALKVKLFLVTKDKALTTTKVSPLVDGDLMALDSSMGLLTLLEPHFKEAQQELIKLRAAVDNMTDTTKPTIFCEGPTDKMALDEVLRLFFPTIFTQVAVRCSTHHGGGHTWVGEMMVAWSHSRPLAKAVGLFDKDSAAMTTAKETSQKIKNAPSGKTAFVIYLIPGEEVKECSRRHFKVPFALEELLPSDMWDFAEGKGWLENRTNPMELYTFKDPSISFTDYVNKTFPEPHLKRIALQKPILEKKDAFMKHVVKLPLTERKRALAGLKATMDEIIKNLSIVSQPSS